VVRKRRTTRTVGAAAGGEARARAGSEAALASADGDAAAPGREASPPGLPRGREALLRAPPAGVPCTTCVNSGGGRPGVPSCAPAAPWQRIAQSARPFLARRGARGSIARAARRHRRAAGAAVCTQVQQRALRMVGLPLAAAAKAAASASACVPYELRRGGPNGGGGAAGAA
jgi:hypothetical protein